MKQLYAFYFKILMNVIYLYVFISITSNLLPPQMQYEVTLFNKWFKSNELEINVDKCVLIVM